MVSMICLQDTLICFLCLLTLFSDDFWNTNDAQVICRMLGFDPTFSVATVRSTFGTVSNDFIMDNVECEGNETNILLCTHTKNENCWINEGAGVICEAPGEDLLISTF